MGKWGRICDAGRWDDHAGSHADWLTTRRERYNASPDAKAKVAAIWQRRMGDPLKREAHLADGRQRWRVDPEQRARRLVREAERRKSDPDFRAYHSRKTRAYDEAHPEYLQSRKRRATRRRRARKQAPGHAPYRDIAIFERDAWRCGICHRKVDRLRRYPDALSATIDHIIPLVAGGPDCAINVRLAHARCNISRGTGGEAQLRLLA